MPAGELQDGAVLHFPVCGARERGGVRAAGAARAGGRGVHDRRHQDPGFLHARDGRERTVLPQLRAGAGELHGADLRAQRLLVREHSGAESAAAGKPVRVPVHDAELRQHGVVRRLRLVLGDHQQQLCVVRSGASARRGLLHERSVPHAEGHRAVQQEGVHRNDRTGQPSLPDRGIGALHRVSDLRVRGGGQRIVDGSSAGVESRAGHDVWTVYGWRLACCGRGNGVASELYDRIPRLLLREERQLQRDLHHAARCLLLSGRNDQRIHLQSDRLRRLCDRSDGKANVRMARCVGSAALDEL